MTITYLRKLHRQGASKTRMAQVAGGSTHFDYLDKRYGITRDVEPERHDTPVGMSVGEALGRPRRQFGAAAVPPGKLVPAGIHDVVRIVGQVFNVPDGALVSRSWSSRHLMQPRCAFVGVVRQLWPNLDWTIIAHFLDRDPRMMGVYMRNHNQFYSSPEYTVKVERVMAAMSAEKETV